jgi:hypothetical protein
MKTPNTWSAQISCHFSRTVSVPYSIAANFRLPIRSLQKGPCATIKDISSSTSKTYPRWVEIRNRLPQIPLTLGPVYCQNVKWALLRLKFHYTKNIKINFVPHRKQWSFIAFANWWMLYGEIIIDYCRNYTEKTYIKCIKNAGILVLNVDESTVTTRL